MLFNSHLFLFGFLPLCLVGFHLASRISVRAGVTWLGFMSCVFYAVWRYEFLTLLLGSVIVNFVCARLIWRARERPEHQKRILFAGIVFNIGLLVYYKYCFPFLNALGRLTTLHHQFAGVLLPLGISFFTFTQIAYLVDLQQGAAECEGFRSYLLFVTFFPHLIAGPILHHSEMMPQFKRRIRLNQVDLNVGFTWFVMGLFKKVILADSIAPAADAAFANPHGLTFLPAWIGAITYSLQLYFDFSGYSDMAIGIARMFSIRFPLNFNSPYKARNVIDFWFRWHMTLTRYIMMYLYNPVALAISRKRVAQGKPVARRGSKTASGFAQLIALPTVFTMAIVGVWHGAGFQFLLFGLAHAVYLTANHAWRIFKPRWLTERFPSSRATGLMACSLTLLCVVLAQVLFRANSTSDAFSMLAGMIGLHGWKPDSLSVMRPVLVRVPIRMAIVWLLPNTQQVLARYVTTDPEDLPGARWFTWRPSVAWALTITAALLMSFTWIEDTTRFLYFQF